MKVLFSLAYIYYSSFVHLSQIVPGVTSALAAPLVAGIGPATHKHLSRAVGIVSAHIMEAVPAEQWRALVALDTLIVLMVRDSNFAADRQLFSD